MSDLVEGAAGGLGVKVGADVGPLGLSLAVGTPGSAEDAEAGGTSTGRTPGLGGLPPGVGLAVHVEGVGAQAGREVSSPVAGGGTIAFGLTTPPAPLAQAAPLVAVAAEGAVAVVDPPRVGPVAEAAASPDVFEAARAVAPVSPTAGAGVEGSEGVAPAPAEPAAPAAEEVEDEEGLEVVTPVDGLDPQSAGPLSDLFSVRLAGLADAAVNSLDYLEELGSDGAGWYLVAVAVATAATAGEVYRRRRTPPVEDGVPDVCEGPVAV